MYEKFELGENLCNLARGRSEHQVDKIINMDKAELYGRKQLIKTEGGGSSQFSGVKVSDTLQTLDKFLLDKFLLSVKITTTLWLYNL